MCDRFSLWNFPTAFRVPILLSFSLSDTHPPQSFVSCTSVIARTLVGSQTLLSRHVRQYASQVISAGLCLLCDQFGALIMGNEHRLATFELPINPPPCFPSSPKTPDSWSLIPGHLTRTLLFFCFVFFFRLPSPSVASLTAGRPENTRLSLLCRTRKLLVVTQQPDNHCPVWLLTCVWGLSTSMNTRALFLHHSTRRPDQSHSQSFSCSH